MLKVGDEVIIVGGISRRHENVTVEGISGGDCSIIDAKGNKGVYALKDVAKVRLDRVGRPPFFVTKDGEYVRAASIEYVQLIAKRDRWYCLYYFTGRSRPLEVYCRTETAARAERESFILFAGEGNE